MVRFIADPIGGLPWRPYADLPPEVEGHTEVSADDRPLVRINRSLSAASHRMNRLRSTLAHELYHLVFHAPFYQMRR